MADDPFYSTAAGDRVRRLRVFFSDTDLALDTFARAPKRRQVGCPDGCGTCCQGFDPDVLPAEADAVADHLLASGRPDLLDRAHRNPGADGTCVFYDPENPWHCTIYPVRPLVCRAFGFSRTEDRFGQPVFRFCRHMPTDGPAQLSGTELTEAFPVPPPSITAFGAAQSALLPPEPGARQLLSQAVKASLPKIAWARQIAGSGPDSGS